MKSKTEQGRQLEVLLLKTEKEKKAERNRKSYLKNRDKILARSKARKKANPELYKEYKRNSINELKDGYVRDKLSVMLKCKPTDLDNYPPELIEAYKLNLKLKRKWQEIK